jgi:hypothetical protein
MEKNGRKKYITEECKKLLRKVEWSRSAHGNGMNE